MAKKKTSKKIFEEKVYDLKLKESAFNVAQMQVDEFEREHNAIVDLKKFMGKEFMGVVRTTFIIGKDGRLKQIMDKFKTKSHHDDLLAQLKELGL